jgi:hypothetical protein
VKARVGEGERMGQRESKKGRDIDRAWERKTESERVLEGVREGEIRQEREGKWESARERAREVL